jgi:hypothetical protein
LAASEEAAPVDNGDKPPLSGIAKPPLMYALGVSGTVVEGTDGEIREFRETDGKLTGQGKPAVVHCHGRLKAAG